MGCPNLAACASHLANCSGCEDGKPTRHCPEPGQCGFAPVSCINCMAGMPMDGCPYPEYCPTSSGGTAGNSSDAMSCPMEMFFTSSQSVCVFLSSWHVHSSLQWAVLVLSITVMALCRELLIAHRQHRDRQRRLDLSEKAEMTKVGEGGKTVGQRTPPLTLPTTTGPLARPLMEDGEEEGEEALAKTSNGLLSTLDGADLLYGGLDGVYYALTLLLAYLLMLLVMTYNVTVIAIVIVASTFAHVLVSLSFTAWWRREAEQRKRRNARRSRRAEEAATREGVVGGGVQREGGNTTAPPPYLLDELASAPLPTNDPCCADIDHDAFD